MIWILWSLLQTEPLQVSLPVSTPESSHQAAVIFEDESAISKIILGIDRDAVSVDVVENRLFVKLLKPARGHLDCVVASGKLYRIRIITVTENPTEVLRIRAPKKPEEDPIPAPLKLARMMRTGSTPDEVRRFRLDGLVYESKEVTVRCIMLHRWNGFAGFTCRLVNRSDRPLNVDLSRFRGKGLLLAACRDLTIGPGKETRLYLVFEAAP
jgi:hypothetical protein